MRRFPPRSVAEMQRQSRVPRAHSWIKLVSKRDGTMVWKQDLAQLKQQLPPEPPQAGPPPKPNLPVQPPQSLEDADLLFLKAMGGVAVPPAPPNVGIVPPPAPVVPSRVPDPEPDFAIGLADLKGLRPLAANPVLGASAPLATPKPEVELPKPQEMPIQVVASPIPADPSSGVAQPLAHVLKSASVLATPQPLTEPPPRIRSGPALIHLAAGMAIEVDGALDLRRHGVNDARERLRERVADGLVLQWRTLLVTLGPNEALKQGLLAFLTTPQARVVARYAQAPIPMGGTQAWILYLAQPQREPPDEA